MEIVGKRLCPFTVYLRVQDFGCRTGRVGALSFRSSHLGDKALRRRGSELPGQLPNLALPESLSTLICVTGTRSIPVQTNLKLLELQASSARPGVTAV